MSFVLLLGDPSVVFPFVPLFSNRISAAKHGWCKGMEVRRFRDPCPFVLLEEGFCESMVREVKARVTPA